jgi:hypothetical protein
MNAFSNHKFRDQKLKKPSRHDKQYTHTHIQQRFNEHDTKNQRPSKSFTQISLQNKRKLTDVSAKDTLLIEEVNQRVECNFSKLNQLSQSTEKILDLNKTKSLYSHQHESLNLSETKIFPQKGKIKSSQISFDNVASEMIKQYYVYMIYFLINKLKKLKVKDNLHGVLRPVLFITMVYN